MRDLPAAISSTQDPGCKAALQARYALLAEAVKEVKSPLQQLTDLLRVVEQMNTSVQKLIQEKA
eukprot:10027887-Prorocentrum_lima.AAC.1